MNAADLERYAGLASAAADLARAETLPRFRSVAVQAKADGTVVTEADRDAEHAIRAFLRAETPGFGILGEEFGEEAGERGRPVWVIDPVDGTFGFARGVPLFTTILALVDEGETVVGLIDMPRANERYVGWRGGGAWRDGTRVHASTETDLARAMVAHADDHAFRKVGQEAVLAHLRASCSLLRGYTDAFGHALVLGGGVDVMVDPSLAPWDVAATRLLVPEAGGACFEVQHSSGRSGCVIGSPALVEELASHFVLEGGRA